MWDRVISQNLHKLAGKCCGIGSMVKFFHSLFSGGTMHSGGQWQALLYPFRLLGFWLLFFGIWRVVFIAFHLDKIPADSTGEILTAFLYGLRTDSATAGYVAIIPLLLWIIQQFIQTRIVSIISSWCNGILIVALSIILAANVQLYTEWGTLINSRALWYFSRPSEVMNFLSGAEMASITAGIVLVSACLMFVFRWFRLGSLPYFEKKYALKIVAVPILLLMNVILMRGGFQQIPINESSSYFSLRPFLNHAAINPVWHLGRMYRQSFTPDDNPFTFPEISENEAAQRRNALFATAYKDTPVMLATQRPNVVVIILESWTADAVESCGGLPGITPFFDSLRRQGLLFSNCYGSGMRTDQGVPSILSGFPALPNASVMMLLEKMEKLPSLPAVCSAAGYSTSFYYGGECEFANMKSYLLHCGISNIIDKHSFPTAQMNAKWGAHDEYVLEKHAAEMSAMPQPFFSVILTLSSHEPFEVPDNSPLAPEVGFGNISGSEPKFLYSIHYTDNCLRHYFSRISTEPWYRNTLFVLVADHGHRSAKNRDVSMPESKKIPLLFVGEPLKPEYRGKVLSRISMQHDITATVLAQIGANTEEKERFRWSRNLLDDSAPEFGYYATDNVVGWITPQGANVYEFATNRLLLKPSGDSSAVRDAKAYLRGLEEDFLAW